MSRVEVNSDHWYTPVDVMYRVEKFFRSFMSQDIIDPCTCDEAFDSLPMGLRDVFLPRMDHDFLEYWKEGEFVFLNPPYSRDVGGAGKFTDHLIDLKPESAIVIVNASTDTQWWQRLADHSHAILFVKGRMKFDRVGWGKRVSGGQPRYANCIHLIGQQKRDVAFRRVFGDMGVVR